MNWFKDHFKSVIIYVFIYAILMIFFLYPMPYELYLPGGVESAEEFVQFEQSYSSSGSFNSSYVSVVTKPTPFQYLLAKLNSKTDIRKMGVAESKIPIAEITKKDRLYKLSSIYASLIAAYDAADKEISYTENGVVIIDRIMDTPAYNKLEVGDIIININNTDVNNFEGVTSVLKDIGCNEPFYITILRDDKEITLNIEKEENQNGSCLLGLYIDYTYTNYIFDSKTSNPEFEVIDKTGYGPSAGLIQTLSAYNMLTPVDITYGLKIAGTGTIDEHGNVGIIGGIKQKVFGACKANVDIFFAPDFDYGHEGEFNNYKDALKAKEIMNSDITIVPVKTLDDAINYLMEHYGQNS